MVTCQEARIFIHDSIDGLLTEADSKLLEGHLGRCPCCRAELAELSAIDAALAGVRITPAPRWLSDAVAAEIDRRAVTRRIVERIAFGVGAPAAAVAAVVALRPLAAPGGGSATTARLAGALARVWSPLDNGLAAMTRSPGFSTSWSQNPGVQGFVLALAVASLALLAVVALRLSKQLTIECR